MSSTAASIPRNDETRLTQFDAVWRNRTRKEKKFAKRTTLNASRTFARNYKRACNASMIESGVYQDSLFRNVCTRLVLLFARVWLSAVSRKLDKLDSQIYACLSLLRDRTTNRRRGEIVDSPAANLPPRNFYERGRVPRTLAPCARSRFPRSASE